MADMLSHNRGVTRLCSVGLGVTDLERSTAFYTKVWGLAEVGRSDGAVLLRGHGPGHHILSLHHREKPGLVDASLAVPSRNDLDALFRHATAVGATVETQPGEVASRSGAVCFGLRDPDHRLIWIEVEPPGHAESLGAVDVPVKLAHLVLNTPDSAACASFFVDVLGFRLSDETRLMRFLRCNTDHHAVGVAHSAHATVHHVSFEMRSWNDLMHGVGRLQEAGYKPGWGVGRHGPGDNVFAYFVDPDGYAIEYTAEVQQIDEARHRPGTADDWKRPPSRMDQWGIAGLPLPHMDQAFQGVSQIGNGRSA